MVHEYLFRTDENNAKIKKHVSENKVNLTVDFDNMKNNKDIWIVKCSIPQNDSTSAGILSNLHEYIMTFNPIILTCESSEYYNKRLFPLINEFEGKLRKLLYLANSVSGKSDESKTANNVIYELEEKTLGEIFSLIFIDGKFVTNVKTQANKHPEYSKSEILEYIALLDENSVWDSILYEEDVKTLRLRFGDVRTYRNHVMHAHNISKKEYGKAKYLFENINTELDAAISRIIKSENQTDESYPTYKKLQDALASFSKFEKQINESLIPYAELYMKMYESLKPYAEFQKQIDKSLDLKDNDPT